MSDQTRRPDPRRTATRRSTLCITAMLVCIWVAWAIAVPEHRWPRAGVAVGWLVVLAWLWRRPASRWHGAWSKDPDHYDRRCS